MSPTFRKQRLLPLSQTHALQSHSSGHRRQRNGLARAGVRTDRQGTRPGTRLHSVRAGVGARHKAGHMGAAHVPPGTLIQRPALDGIRIVEDSGLRWRSEPTTTRTRTAGANRCDIGRPGAALSEHGQRAHEGRHERVCEVWTVRPTFKNNSAPDTPRHQIVFYLKRVGFALLRHRIVFT